MPIQTERFADEAIIVATLYKPFEAEYDTATMFRDYLAIRETMPEQDSVVFIINFNDTNDVPDAFSRIVYGMDEAARGIRTSRELLGGQPPILIFVGDDALTRMVAASVVQEQYGGSNSHQCPTVDEALALAREKLAVIQ